MDSIGRLKQLLENGVRVKEGSPSEPYADKRELLGIFPDGTKEYSSRISPVYNTHKKGNMYSQMVNILEKEGIETKGLPIKSKISVDVHTLEMANGKTYHFYTPSRSYLKNKQL